MRVTIRVKCIEWGDRFQLWTGPEEKPVYPDVDGAIRYEIKYYRTEEEIKKILGDTKGDFPNPYVCDLYYQPFSRKGTYRQSDGRNVWAWDGNKEAPTLSPSWLIEWADPKEFRVSL